MIRLALLTSPTLFLSLLSLGMLVKPGLAGQAPITIPVPAPETAASERCIPTPHSKFNLVCTRANATPTVTEVAKVRSTVIDPNAILEFTEEESNTAMRLFGCDCPLCLNALRQLRNQPPLNRA